MSALLSCALVGVLAVPPITASAESGIDVASVERDDVDRYVSFDGVRQWAQATSTAFDIVNDISVSAWVRPDVVTCATECVIAAKDGAYGIYISAGVYWYQFNNGSTWTKVSSDVTARVGEWTHVALTRVKSSGAATFYVNGIAVKTSTYTAALGTSTDVFALGAWAESSTIYTAALPLDGDVDDVRLWNVVRSQAQIASDMHTWGPTDTAGLVGYWDLNEISNESARNLASGSSPATNLSLVNRPAKPDIKIESIAGSNTVVTFPRSYLTSAGGWRGPGISTSVSYLVVGGGGGGGAHVGGGGGGGGVVAGTGSVSSKDVVAVSVGPGGIGGLLATPCSNPCLTSRRSISGGDSSLVLATGDVRAVGGGSGGHWNYYDPRPGGSGGGSGHSTPAGALGTTGQGSAGGSGHPVTPLLAGGGGGAGGIGTTASASQAGNGGPGVTSSISGSSLAYGGGGGGGIHTLDNTLNPGTGGSGVGGAGAEQSNAKAGNGMIGRGGGGGGGANSNQQRNEGGDGGSGVVIVSFVTSANSCLTEQVTQGAHTIVAFKDIATCSWAVPSGVTAIDYLVVAGGGGGGTRDGGGGGAGGYVAATSRSVTGVNTLSITVGAGGAGGQAVQASGANGSNSVLSGDGGFTTVTAIGGGGGGTNITAAGNGGSGGGAGGGSGVNGSSATPGTATGGQGNNGGNGRKADCAGAGSKWCAGGGGGAGTVGGNAVSGGAAGSGGAGLMFSWIAGSSAQRLGIGEVSGSDAYFAGGGGGGAETGGTAGIGGLGGGGNGSISHNAAGEDADDNTGGGGGGSGYDQSLGQSVGGNGGSGVVVIRYTTASITTSSSVDSAAVLNGSSSHFSVAEGTEFLSRATYTAETWIYPTTVTCSSICPIMSHDGDYIVSIKDGVIRADVYHTSTNQYNTWTSKVYAKVNEWQHVALVRDGSTARLYFNGDLMESFTLGGSGRSTYTGYVLWIGKHYANFYTGRVDHFRYWSTARTESQIKTAMHEHTPSTSTGLIAQYDFNGVTGTTVANTAPSAAAGTSLTANNSPTYVDVKTLSNVGKDAVVTFPRSYLTASGGWTVPTNAQTLSVLAVGGGGGGGTDAGGGGGGGAMRFENNVAVTVGTSVTVKVGQGGRPGSWGGGVGAGWTPTAGQSSTIAWGARTYTAGGGAGGENWRGASGGNPAGIPQGGAGGTSSGNGSGTNGGSGGNGPLSDCSNTLTQGFTGGNGSSSSVTGTSTTYGGGGGGGVQVMWDTTSSATIAGRAGGTGGGGRGADWNLTTRKATTGYPGTDGLGGGGGGSHACGSADNHDRLTGHRTDGGDGGSGIVVIRYSVVEVCAPVISRVGVYVVTKFMSVGECTWTVPTGVTSLDYLVVAGGGGGGAWQSLSGGGGGGAGGVLDGSALAVTPSQSMTITVGGGGTGGVSTADDVGVNGTAGGNSSLSGSGFTTVSATGGGYGSGDGTSYAGGNGGSGGGALGSSATSATGGTGIAGPPRQGYNGGSNNTACGTERPSGGGGGAGGAGGTASCTGDQSGHGGVGRKVSITGASTMYGGGGGGGASGTGAVAGNGGLGGGGNGGGIRGVDGIDGLGGGGGGAGYNTTVNVNVSGGDGGDGVVILRHVDRVLSVSAGNNQTASPSVQLPTNPKVIVRDAAGNPVDGVPVTFAVTAGGGTLGTTTVTTSGGGFAETIWTLGTSGTQTMTATMGLVGSTTETFTATISSVVCDIGFDELNFDFSNKQVISAANASKPGFSKTDKILFRSIATKNCDGVLTTIDALVTTSDLVGATVQAYEANAKAGGANSYFQVDADITATNGYAEFTFQFYENGTYGTSNKRVALQNVKITAIDIDYYQYNYVTGIDSFTVAGNTRLTTTRTPASSFPTDAKFQGSSIIGDNDPRDQVVMGFGEVLDFAIRFGRSSASSPNYYGVAFKELGWGASTPVTAGEQFTLSYDANGAGGGSAPASQDSGVGGNVTVASNSGSMTRSGYTFTGWNTAANGSGTTYLAGSAFVMPQGGATLYAVWTPTNYSVIYNANGGSTAPNTQTVAFNATVTVAGAGSMTRAGYTFAGWNTAANGTGTSRAAASTFSMPASNVTLYAQWTLNSFTVTYDANGGASPPSAATANAGSTVTVSGAGSMTRTGHTFTGWNTAANGSGTSRTAGSTFVLNSDVTLFAQWSVNTYTVTYHANGGSNAPASLTKAYNSTVTVAGAGSMTRSGYTFAGWNTAANGTGTSRAVASTFSMPDANVTLYAQWTANQHDVIYVVNDDANDVASNIPATQANNNFGSTVTVGGSSPAPARPNYVFNGWNTAANGSGSAYLAGDSLTQPDNDVTLYAQWVPANYDLFYNANGGIGTPSGGTFGYGSTLTASTSVPTRTGYEFVEWNTAANGSGTSLPAGTQFTLSANTTLYARWMIRSYTVAYSGNGGGGVPANQSGINYAATATVAGGVPTRNGYSFVGWNTAANGTGSSYTGGNTFVMPAANVTMYAQWAANQYTVTYDANGGSQPPSGQTAGTDTSVTVAGAGSMSRSGYTFAGWNTAPDGTGTSRSASSAFSMPASNVTLYAQWTATIQTVTYNANGGSGAPGSTTAPTDGSVTVSGTVPSRAGYAFVGWNTAANGGGTDYVGGDTFTMPASAVTLYAKWTALSYTVSYNANGGTGAPSQQTEFTDASVTVSSTAPTRPGYSLVAWNTRLNGSGIVRTVGGTFTMPAADVVLYAQWIANSNQVLYNATGGTGAPANMSAITDSTVTVSNTTPTRNGYVFAGWNTAADGSGDDFSPSDTFVMPGANVTLYAQWTTRNYTITYDANGGSSAPSAQIEPYLSTATLSANLPVYTGYIFMGWTTNQQGQSNAYLNGSTFVMPSNDVTLYAQWQADTNDLYFFANGGVGGPSAGVATTGSTVTLSTVAATRPTRTGYLFKGWKISSTAATVDYEWDGSAYSPATFTMPGTDVFLYAHWEAIDYTVTYDANNGSGSVPSTVTANFQDSVVVDQATGLTRSGFTFVGWNTAANRSGTDYAPTQVLSMPAANVVLYAIWQAKVNAIVYNAAGGSNAPSPQFAATSQSQTLSSQLPSRTGHTFVRWVDSFGTPRQPGDSVTMPASSTMLFAEWSINSYSLSYNANGGTGAPASSTVEYGATATVSGATPTRNGYSFSGWNTSASGNGTPYALLAAFSMPAENLTLYAQWTATPVAQSPEQSPSTPPATVPAAKKRKPDIVQTGVGAMSGAFQAMALILLGAALMVVSRRRSNNPTAGN